MNRESRELPRPEPLAAMFEHIWNRHKDQSPGLGETAPEISLESLDDRRFILSETAAQGPTVLAFFKVSCSTCQFTFPFLERLHKGYSDEPVHFRAISQDDPELSRRFARHFGFTFPIAIDPPPYSASRSYHFANVPTILLVDRDRVVRFRTTGFSKTELIRLSEEIAAMLEHEPAPVFLANEKVPEMKPG
jgi:peroxiredoxin